jgi:hypothetical protein
MAAIHIKGAPLAGQRVFHHRCSFSGRRQAFEAENGMISVHTEEKDGRESFERVPRAEFVARAIAINEQAKRAKYPRERKALDDLACCMIAAAKAARHQGDPFASPRVARDVVASQRRILVGGVDSGAPLMPEARPDAKFKDLGGTQTVDPKKVIIVPG